MAISQRAHEILNSEKLIQQREKWRQRLDRLFHGEKDEWTASHVPAINGIVGSSSADLFAEPERWVEECLEDLAARYAALENEVYFQPLCVEGHPYGVHYTDKVLGANVFRKDNEWYNDYLASPVGSLQMPDLDQSAVWKLTKRMVQAFVEADVRVPLFGLTVIASPLNVAVNLYGERILMDMLLEPEKAEDDLNTITELQCEIHRRFQAMLPPEQLQTSVSWLRTMPEGYGQLCGCSTQLLSGSCYEEMVAELDNRLLGVYPNGGLIHLCGQHTQHISTFRDMKNLKAIQIQDRAAEDLAAYHQGLREDQLIYLIPSKTVSIEHAVRLTGGERLVILETHVDSPIMKN